MDEMLGERLARKLRDRGHDVVSVVADHRLVGRSDDQILAHAAGSGRAVVTTNIRDFVLLDGQYRDRGASHAGLVLVSTKTFPQDGSFQGAMLTALDKLRSQEDVFTGGQVRFLER
nr:DUF5615 family PIN-like protein [Kutzneria buriramensis]